MDQVSEGGGGPFAYYPVTGDAIREAAAETDRQASHIRAVRSQLVGAHRNMMSAIAGDIGGPIATAPEATTANIEQVVRTSCFAAGVMRLFADAVDQFNHTSTAPRSVDRLNAAYTEARLDDIGLEPGADFDADWRKANAAMLGTLTIEYARLEEQLDIWADHAARMLNRGPTPDDVRELWALGALPPDAALLWPSLDLNESPVLRLPYELRDEVDDRGLTEVSDHDLMGLWREHGYEPARELLGDRVAYDAENMTALTELNLNMNPHYWKALSEGLPKDVARQIADANPASFVDILAPYMIAGEFLYGITARDLVDAVRDDPWSLRSLGEIAMAATPARLGKLTKIDNAVDAIDDTRDAVGALRAAELREHLRQSLKYGEDGFRVLENGRFRYYSEVDSAKTPGAMLGRRMVREWDPATGLKRTWHETLDHSGTVRILRPQNGPNKTHYHFDEQGNYGGSR